MSFSDTLLPPALSRRRLARIIAGGAVAAPAVALAAQHPPAATAAPGDGGRVRLRPDPGSVVRAADVPLAGRAQTARSAGTFRSRVLETTGFSMLGVTWRGGNGHVRVRVRRPGGWSGWQPVPLLHDGPDTTSEEARRTPRATDLLWVGRAEAVQVEISGAPREPVLALIDPGRQPDDHRDTAVADDVTAAAKGRAPKPKLLGRKKWGANPKLHDGTQVVNKVLKQVHVHHTVNSNDYKRGDVPAMIRGMYRYHTQSLGWSDLGYNFLVDRFGRIWVGRRGSARKLVRGAHTLGFNHSAVGVAVIGNFEVKRPNDKIVRAIVRLAAWRLDRYDLPPRGKVKRRSHGSDLYPAGRVVKLPVIDGHRDTNQTACPGKHLYAEIPRIRRRTARRIRRFRKG